MMRNDAVHFWRPVPGGTTDFLAASLQAGLTRPHVHEEWQFAVADHRSCLCLGAFQRVLVHPGDVVVIAPFDVHAERDWVGQEAGWRVLHVADARVAGLRADPSSPPFQSRVLEDAETAGELRSLLGLSEAGLAGDHFVPVVEHWLRRLFARHPARITSGTPSRRVEHARRYLRERPGEVVSLRETAAAAGVTTWHLARTFSRVVGLPPMGYHLQTRLARARRLLGEGTSATRVAYECGFADQSHLGRRFKEYHQLTPGTFQTQTMARVAEPGDPMASPDWSAA